MKNYNERDTPILSLQYHYDVWFFLHIFIWSISLFFVFMGTLYNLNNPIMFIIGSTISSLIFYKKIFYFLKKVNIDLYEKYILINGKKYFYDDISFSLRKDTRATQVYGIFFKKNKKILSFIIQSFLCPALVKCDPDYLHSIFTSIKSGNITNSYLVCKKCNHESKYNMLISLFILLFFLLLLSPIIIMVKLRGIPLF